MSINKPRFFEGQNVKYLGTGKTGTINKILAGTRSYSYKVTIDGQQKTIAEHYLEPAIDLEENILESFQKGKVGTHSDYRLFQTWFRLSKPLESNIYSYLGSKTLFNPYQFKPLLRFLSSNSNERLFIADEVGVGKTIEAGIIITELLARGRLDYCSSILVVCPYSLGPKWAREMKERFRLNFHLHDGNSLECMLKTLLAGEPIPQSFRNSIVSLQLLRRKENLTLLQELDSKRERPVFTMVVIDEAHHMRNSETDSHRLGSTLSSLTEMMLMLSATPLNLRNEDLFNQMNILNPVLFPDITVFETLQSPSIHLNRIRAKLSRNAPGEAEDVLNHLRDLSESPLGKVVCAHPGIIRLTERFNEKTPLSPDEIARYDRLLVSLSPLFYSFTRTRKREALDHQVQREAWELPIDLSDKELRFQDDVLSAVRKFYIVKGKPQLILGFIINTYRRMVSSCIPAMREYLSWCIKDNRILNYEFEPTEDVEDDSQLELAELDPSLKSEFSRILKEAEQIEGIDSKYIQFKQMITKIITNPETPQVIVFSFFIRTLEYLKRRLEKDGFTVGIIHGKMPLQREDGIAGRYEIMDAFRRGKYQILLSSEVGGEGLDFQYCHAIVNYDLPYNPMRIEQRIGRIDRFGQKADKIIVVNSFIKGTVDEEIYDRLYRRIRLVEDGIGVLEPIIGKPLADVQLAIITGTLTESQKEEQLRRIEEQIAAAKVEMEEFEKSRKELLSDDYLTVPLNTITKGGFVSPDDAIQLTEHCLSKWDGCAFRRMGRGYGELTLSEKIINDLESFIMQPRNEASYAELSPLISKRMNVKVVFDGSLAEDLVDYQFLSPTGFWTRFLKYQLEQEGALFKTFSFRMPTGDEIPAGRYITFLFEVRLEGIRTEIEFLGVPVNIDDRSIPTVKFEEIPRILSNAEGLPIQPPMELDPNELLNAARDRLALLLEQKRSEAVEENLFRVESRIAALTKSSEMKIKKLQDQLEAHKSKRIDEGRAPDESYVRLTLARIEKERARLKLEENNLQSHRELSLDYNLEALVYLEVGN